jgi:kynurenine formamidase
MFIDLTHTFTDSMPVYPGDPCSRLYQSHFIKDAGFSDHRVESNMHVGTHMDAPLHMVEGGAYIAEIPLPHFNGAGHLVDARNKRSVAADLLANHSVKKGDIVLVWTDWSKKFHDPDYFDNYPQITEDFARQLVALGVSIMGLDTPSPDKDPFPIHKILLGKNVLIVENLTNLESLEAFKSFRIHAYPIKYKADGAPVRVVAETNG